MFFIRILGPVLGFVIGGITNRYYYSFDVPPGLSPRDPMWIGRWWAGFLGISVVLFGPSLALYLFPAPSKKKRDDEEDEKIVADDEKVFFHCSAYSFCFQVSAFRFFEVLISCQLLCTKKSSSSLINSIQSELNTKASR
ncbi:Solute carrier organic anion transporter family member 3A1 [Toxocara canis]|uniref:Solute carrier organic anion transporter family member 3A1 n=1 Tax=Toxocara canis TaxID=6265 RepID=A0A0B2UQG4_TOXCA|nr:Solute carrier organic anion transporter family member 3A1 [Toxocara canis]